MGVIRSQSDGLKHFSESKPGIELMRQLIDIEIRGRIQMLVSRGELCQEEAGKIENILIHSSPPTPQKSIVKNVVDNFLDSQQIPTRLDLAEVYSRLNAIDQKINNLVSSSDLKKES